MNRSKSHIQTLYALLVLYLAIGCADPTGGRVRGQETPQRSEYIGGPDGGYWISCEPRTAADLDCTVYDGADGRASRVLYLTLCVSLIFDGQASVPVPRTLDGRGLMLDRVWAIRRAPDLVLMDDTFGDQELAISQFAALIEAQECPAVERY